MKVLEMVHGIIWGPWTVGVFLVVGLVLSVRCRFFQIRGFRYWWKATAGSLWGEEREGDEVQVLPGPTMELHSSSRSVPPLQQRWGPVILQVWQPLLYPVVREPCSGCGSPH